MKTILLVHGNQERLMDLWRLLDRSGYRVIAKTNGRTALMLVEEGVDVDLVIASCEAPGIDGLELLDAMKRSAPSAPVIMLNEQGSVERYLKAASRGAYDCLNMPVDAGELVRIIRKALAETEPGRRAGRAAEPAFRRVRLVDFV